MWKIKARSFLKREREVYIRWVYCNVLLLTSDNKICYVFKTSRTRCINVKDRQYMALA